MSKAENRFRDLAGIVPGAQAHELARVCGKDPRKVQAVLDESTEVVRVAGNGTTGVLITRHRQGWVRVATRYDRCAKTFLSAVALAATVMFWL